jgi:hypothetical protein
MFARAVRFHRLPAHLPLAILALVVLACGGIGDKPVIISTAKLDEKLVFNDSTWVVLAAKDLGKSLKPADPADGDRTTDGRFLLVRYRVSNTSKQELLLGNPPVLQDERDRTFGTLSEQERYLPKEAGVDESSDRIPVGMAREFRALYEVPADAKGLRLHMREFQQAGFVELGQ